jgi:hypothetical protein
LVFLLKQVTRHGSFAEVDELLTRLGKSNEARATTVVMVDTADTVTVSHDDPGRKSGFEDDRFHSFIQK